VPYDATGQPLAVVRGVDLAQPQPHPAP
jgi:hypothetical protein